MSTIPRGRHQAESGPSRTTSSSRLAEGEPVPKRRRTENGAVPVVHHPTEQVEVVSHVPAEQEPTVVSPLIVDLTSSPSPLEDDEVVVVREREGQHRNATSRHTTTDTNVRAQMRRLRRHLVSVARAHGLSTNTRMPAAAALGGTSTRNPVHPADRAAPRMEFMSPAAMIAAQAAEIAVRLADDGGHARENPPIQNRVNPRHHLHMQPVHVSFRNGNMMFRFHVAQQQNAEPIDPATVHVPEHLRDAPGPEAEPAAVVDESNPAIAEAGAGGSEEPSSHKCPICLDGIKRMVSTPCGHVFCCNCLLAALQARKQCPKCRKACGPKQVHRIFLE